MNKITNINICLVLFTLCYLPVFIGLYTIRYFCGPIYGVRILDELFGHYRVNLNSKNNERSEYSNKKLTKESNKERKPSRLKEKYKKI